MEHDWEATCVLTTELLGASSLSGAAVLMKVNKMRQKQTTVDALLAKLKQNKNNMMWFL